MATDEMGEYLCPAVSLGGGGGCLGLLKFCLSFKVGVSPEVFDPESSGSEQHSEELR